MPGRRDSKPDPVRATQTHAGRAEIRLRRLLAEAAARGGSCDLAPGKSRSRSSFLSRVSVF